MLVTDFWHWWHILVVDARSWCLKIEDVGDKTAKTVTNISKMPPTHFVSNIRHQHRCSRNLSPTSQSHFNHNLKSKSIEMNQFKLMHFRRNAHFGNSLHNVIIIYFQWRKFTNFSSMTSEFIWRKIIMKYKNIIFHLGRRSFLIIQ